MDPRTGLDAVEKRKISCSYRDSNPGRYTGGAIPWLLVVK
jgi:hypothetical protein